MQLVWKLLRQHISIPQFAGFFLANLVGMTIILLGLQFYTDIQSVYEGEDSFMKADYFIINKKISAVTTLTGKSNAFSAGEMEELASQPFIEKLGKFTSSAYDVKATFNLEEGTSFSTEMFFESVPDEFVDVKSEDWKFHEGSKDIPIILPRNYLDLYNFGYAQSRSLPKLSEGILGMIRLKINIDGMGMHDVYEGRIVGFSSRLNTILVPQEFMDWANEAYAADKASPATRLIMQVNNPTDDRITSYLQDNGYETDQDKLSASKTTFILRLVVGIVMTIGLVICILSFYILMLSVYLLVEKNMTKLENLLLIGYSPRKVSMPYQVLTVGLNALVFIIAVVVLMIARGQYLAMFESFFPEMQTPSMMPTMGVGIGLLVVVSVVNVIVVYTKVMSIWKRKD